MTRMATVGYLVLQGGLVLGWWLLLWFVPSTRDLFKAAEHPDSALLAFWFADLACIAVGSIVSGWWAFRRDVHAVAAVWFTAGAVVYAALYCIILSTMTGQAIMAAALMCPAAIITVLVARRVPVR
jgi:hypothetical protein